MARTTNRLEGGVNSPLKRMLLNHRGLPEEHMRRACEWMCYMKSRNPKPSSLIRPEQRKPARASTAGSADDVGVGVPEYGTGIAWDEFHAHVPWGSGD